MWNWIRGFFVRHDWVFVDEEQHQCSVCQAVREPDYEMDDLTPGSWHIVKKGDISRHFETKPKRAPVPRAPSPANHHGDELEGVQLH